MHLLCCGGGATAKSALKAAREQQDKEDSVKGYTVYKIDENGNVHREGIFFRILMFLFGLVFGVIITPIRIIGSLREISRLKDAIKNIESRLQDKSQEKEAQKA